MNRFAFASAADPVPAGYSTGPEMPADIAARDRLLDRAMGATWRRKASEKLRRGRLPALALVARDGAGRVFGTVRLWHVDAGGKPALLLGPLAVDPSFHGGGVGSALMRAAIAAARDGGHGAVLLMGDPEYYGRFGFSADRTGGLAMPGPFEKRRFLGLELRQGGLDSVVGVLRPTGVKVDASRRAA